MGFVFWIIAGFLLGAATVIGLAALGFARGNWGEPDDTDQAGA